jgi:hypothetical protein
MNHGAILSGWIQSGNDPEEIDLMSRTLGTEFAEK